MDMPRLFWLAALPALAASDPGLTGGAFARTASGGIGAPIAGVRITFIRENLSAAFTATTDAAGRYSIALPVARYYWVATHASFQDETSAPGFAVVTGPNRQTANFFLRSPAVTTVLVVRHAEKLNPASDAQNEPLSPAGQARAKVLRETLFRSGVSAVFTTDTVRTRETVRPLAEAFRITPQIYSTPADVASRILANHSGDVVLVAAHSNTVGLVANALGGAVPADSVPDFDNLYLVSRAGTQAKVVNLQYGAASTPDIVKNSGSAKTILLAGRDGTAPLPAELLQAARKAGVAAIRTEGSAPLVGSLASALGLTPTAFTSAQLPNAVNAILSGTAPTVLMAASNASIQAVVKQLGANPLPIVYATDLDHLVVVTRFASGAARTIPLRF